MTENHPANTKATALELLNSIAAKRRILQIELAELEESMNEKATAAVNAGATWTEVAAVTGMTRSHAYLFFDRKRKQKAS